MSLLANHTLLGRLKVGNITYVSSTSVPADNGTNTTAPIVFTTKPAGMLVGDLVLVFCSTRNNVTTFDADPNTGGQTWTGLSTVAPNASGSSRVYWCRFTGSWPSDPSFGFSTAGSTVHSAVMHVFRPTAPQNIWALEAEHTATTDNTNPVTIGTQTTTNVATLNIGFWFVDNSSTYDNLIGTDWISFGTAQYRNLGGSDTSTSYAYKVMLAPGATGSVSKDQVLNTFGHQQMFTFYETAS